MRICIAEAAMFKNLPFEEALQEISKIGYAGLEGGWGSRFSADAKESEIEGVKKLVRSHGLEFYALGGGGALASEDEKARSKAIEDARLQIRAAEILGCKIITAEMSGGTSERRDQCISAFKESMGEIIPLLEKANVSMSFEPHPGDFIEESNMGVDVLRSLSSKHIGYLYCCPHTFVLGSDPAEMIRYAGDKLNWVHVADTNRVERIVVSFAKRGFASLAGVPEFEGLKAHEHLVPGRGEVPLDVVFTSLKEIGYDGPVSCMPFVSDAPIAAATQSFEVVRRYV